MSEYIVSARKYRPDSFETLVGQDTIARTLKNSILRGQLAHAYLFCGPRGVGKTTTARIFAKMINCSNPNEDMEPCGKCESCLSFAEGRSYCIHELDAASNNGVEDIKALIDQVRVPPQVGKYSVYIIDEVHMLTPSAFNAFLKTLEEPPAHAIFILATTEKHKILPTILSRCQTYDFNRISVEDIVLNLKMIASRENVTIDDESLHVIAVKADGAMRDALTIFDQTVAFCGSDIHYKDVIKNLNVLDYEYTFALTEAFLKGDYATAILKFDEILSKGFNALHFVGAVSSHFRNLLISHTGGMESLLELPKSLKERYAEQASRCSVKFLYDALDITSKCEAGYRTSINQRLHIEFALMKLCFINGAQPSTDAVATAPVAVPVATVSVAAVPVAAAPVAQEISSPKAAEETVISATAGTKEEPSEEQVGRTRRRGRAAAGVSMSLKSIAEKADQTPKVEEQVVADKVPEDEEIRQTWTTKLVELYSAQPRLACTLQSAQIDIVDENGAKSVTFLVQNDAQKKWIEEKRLFELEGNLRKLLNTSNIYLHVGTVPVEEAATTIYLPSEKAKDLREKNPEVDALIKQLHMEPK